jgi:hypothetical protein
MPDTKYLKSNVRGSLLMGINSTLWTECTEILKSKGNSSRDHCALECDAMQLGTAQHHVPADGELHTCSCDISCSGDKNIFSLYE